MMKGTFVWLGGLLSLLLSVFPACRQAKYRGLPEDVALEWALDRFAESTAQKHGMKFLFVGDVANNVSAYYSVAFSSPKQITLAEGETLARQVAQEWLNMLRHDENVRKHIEFLRARRVYFDPNKDKVEMTHSSFRIGFWDEDVNRPKPPFLAEILFNKNTFYYYEADPETQKLRLVLEESYDEAMSSQPYQQGDEKK